MPCGTHSSAGTATYPCGCQTCSECANQLAKWDPSCPECRKPHKGHIVHASASSGHATAKRVGATKQTPASQSAYASSSSTPVPPRAAGKRVASSSQPASGLPKKRAAGAGRVETATPGPSQYAPASSLSDPNGSALQIRVKNLERDVSSLTRARDAALAELETAKKRVAELDDALVVDQVPILRRANAAEKKSEQLRREVEDLEEDNRVLKIEVASLKQAHRDTKGKDRDVAWLRNENAKLREKLELSEENFRHLYSVHTGRIAHMSAPSSPPSLRRSSSSSLPPSSPLTNTLSLLDDDLFDDDDNDDVLVIQHSSSQPSASSHRSQTKARDWDDALMLPPSSQSQSDSQPSPAPKSRITTATSTPTAAKRKAPDEASAPVSTLAAWLAQSAKGSASNNKKGVVPTGPKRGRRV